MSNSFKKNYDELRVNGFSHEEALQLINDRAENLDEDELYVLEDVTLLSEPEAEDDEDIDNDDSTLLTFLDSEDFFDNSEFFEERDNIDD